MASLTEEQGNRRASGCWVFLAVIVMLIVIVIAVLYGCDVALRRRLDARIAADRARGQPVTFAEFMEKRRAATPPDYSALGFLDALEQLQVVDDADDGRAAVIVRFMLSTEPGVRRSDELRAMMREEVEARARALALVREASALPVGSYPIDTSGPPWAIEMPHLAQMRSAARLCRRAALVRAEDGDGRAAAEFAADGLAMARSMGDWPVLIELLVELAMRSIALGGLSDSLALCEMPADSLATLRGALRTAEAGDRLGSALLAERAVGHCALVEVPGDELADVVAMGANHELPRIVGKLYAAAPLWRTADALFYHKLMDIQIDAWEAPPAERRQAVDLANRQIEAEMTASGGMHHPLSMMLMPALHRACEEDMKAIARARVARVALAVEQWRMEHGTWPESLEQLVPEVIDDLPDDPFTDGPLLYARTEDGVTVYSVGLDGADDAGLRPQDAVDLDPTSEPPDDIPSCLLNVELRGARTSTFRDEVLEAEWLKLKELGLFGFDEARLRTHGFTDEDLRRMGERY